MIDVSEAAYADAEDETWLLHVLEAARPLLDAGLGVLGFFYDFADPDAPIVRPPILIDTPDGTREAITTLLDEAPRPFLHALHRLVPSCTTMSERLGLGDDVVDLPIHQSILAPLGVADFLAIAATAASGAGCLIGAPLPRVTKMSALDEDALTALAAHVTAGMRLRRDRESEPPATDGPWAIVDAFDRGGSRFVVARRRDESTSERALTKREHDVISRAALGHSNKRIAIELGVAPSTIAGHLTNVAKKLGAHSRVELIGIFLRNVRSLGGEKNH